MKPHEGLARATRGWLTANRAFRYLVCIGWLCVCALCNRLTAFLLISWLTFTSFLLGCWWFTWFGLLPGVICTPKLLAQWNPRVSVTLVDTENYHVVVFETVFENVPENKVGAWLGDLDRINGAHWEIELLIYLEDVAGCVGTAHDELIQDVHNLLIIVCLAHETIEKRVNVYFTWCKGLACVKVCFLTDFIIILYQKGQSWHRLQFRHNVDSLVPIHYCPVYENIASIHTLLSSLFHLFLFCKDNYRTCFVSHCFFKNSRLQCATLD